MAILKVKDAAGEEQHLSVTGTGTAADPFVMNNTIVGPVDSSTDTLLVIDHAHYEIHAGNSYLYSGQVDLNNAETKTLMLQTPDTAKRIHLEKFVRSSFEGSVKLYESAVVSVAGSVKTAFNRERNSAQAATLIIQEDTTFSSLGTLLEESHFGAGNKSGGENGERKEWVLKQNTVYQLLITSEAASNDINYKIDWSEQ